MVTCDIEDFSFEKWYSHFESDAVESIIIPIPSDALEYLRVSPLILPKEACRKTCRNPSTDRNYSVEWSDEDDSPELEAPTFPEFSIELKDALNSLGGEVFIKSNWHAPKDATWIKTGRNLKCTSLEDIYLLLKSSDIVSRDICHEFKSVDGRDIGKHCVVIKRWMDFHPGCEFRCFVKENQLIAISQRDCSSFYAHINARKYDIIKDIMNFYHSNVKLKFPSANYVFDIARLVNNSIKIIDFQPFDKNYSDSLLFVWEELFKMKITLEDIDENSAEIGEQNPEFRFFAEDPGVQPKPCQLGGMPYEIKELCGNMGGMTLMDFLCQEVSRQNSQPE